MSHDIEVTITKRPPGGNQAFRYTVTNKPVADKQLIIFGFGTTRRGAIRDWKKSYQKAQKAQKAQKRVIQPQVETVLVRV